jgi:GMP synthase-like glutamine amidotransferase
MRIHYLQHVPFENPGSILDWARENGYPVTDTQIYRDSRLPAQDEFDWLVVMGGPMNIYEDEKYPWLTFEKQFIRNAIAGGKVVIGLCLGGQLIADAIGGKVTRNPQVEIGWLPVALTEQAHAMPLFSDFPPRPVVFQWHGDTFSVLPKDAECVAQSAACDHQAFVYKKRVFGFQFHLENTLQIIENLIENCGDEMIPGDFVQMPDALLAHSEYIAQCNGLMGKFLTTLGKLESEGAL